MKAERKVGISFIFEGLTIFSIVSDFLAAIVKNGEKVCWEKRRGVGQ